MSRPNILIVMTDHQRADTALPDHPSITPNLDRLAEEGVSFTNTYRFAPLLPLSGHILQRALSLATWGVEQYLQPSGAEHGAEGRRAPVERRSGRSRVRSALHGQMACQR